MSKNAAAAFQQSQRDNSKAPANETAAPAYAPVQSSIIQSHAYRSAETEKQIYLNDPAEIEKLLLGNGAPPDPAALNLPSWEPTKCSVRENGLIMGYAANTN